MQDQDHPSRSRPGHSRRDFLRGSGAAAVAAALANAPGEALAQDDKPQLFARGVNAIKLNVNGKEREVLVENRMTLLEVLRYQLGLTGAKPVSIDGSSGASTVLLDGKPVSANTTLAVECAGHKVRTVESLGGKKPDAVALAFTHHDASQCGFCTPGFVVAVRAFLTKNPKASEAEIREGLNGNLCRCGTYADIIHAALEVVKGGKNG